MKFFYVTLLIITLFTGTAFAQYIYPKTTTDAQAEEVGKYLCLCVGLRQEAPHPNPEYKFDYQRVIYEAAGVDLEKDDFEEESRKVRVWWNKYGHAIKCPGAYDVLQGNLLCLGAHKYYTEFIEDVVAWKLDVNDITMAGTVLDYVRAQIGYYKGQESVEDFKYYERLLKADGAKTQLELTGKPASY